MNDRLTPEDAKLLPDGEIVIARQERLTLAEAHELVWRGEISPATAAWGERVRRENPRAYA